MPSNSETGNICEEKGLIKSIIESTVSVNTARAMVLEYQEKKTFREDGKMKGENEGPPLCCHLSLSFQKDAWFQVLHIRSHQVELQ
jgi:hypothetical protein